MAKLYKFNNKRNEWVFCGMCPVSEALENADLGYVVLYP
jgi:hypothetical protein